MIMAMMAKTAVRSQRQRKPDLIMKAEGKKQEKRKKLLLDWTLETQNRLQKRILSMMSPTPI